MYLSTYLFLKYNDIKSNNQILSLCTCILKIFEEHPLCFKNIQFTLTSKDASILDDDSRFLIMYDTSLALMGSVSDFI